MTRKLLAAVRTPTARYLYALAIVIAMFAVLQLLETAWLKIMVAAIGSVAANAIIVRASANASGR